MNEFLSRSLSNWRGALRFGVFWIALGVLSGPVVGFLFGARSGRDFWLSIQAGLLFAFTLGFAIVGVHRIRPLVVAKARDDDGRALLADATLRLVVTLVATVGGAALVDALVIPGFLRSPRAMGSMVIYMTVGAALFMAVDYAAKFQRIYRARVRSEEQYKARVEEEMRIAAAIQRALLPRPWSREGAMRITGKTIPNRTIAGDFFDHFEIEGGGLAFVIGDVAGKGPPAAILAAAIQGMVAAYLPASGAPGPALERLNVALHHRMAESRFATVVLGIVDPEGRMIVSNAGHPRALLVRADGSTSPLERGGPLLGVFEESRFEEDRVLLRSGDSVVLFSDGVSEARNASDEQFGDDRVLATVTASRGSHPEGMLEALLDEVWRFTGGTPPEDDVTVVVIRCQSPA